MKAVMLDVPAELLEERRRKGLDRRDEMWEGVLHMVPPPSEWHQRVGSRLLVAITPVAERLGLIATYETGLFRVAAKGKDYRTPDLIVTRPEQRTLDGAAGAELVVEVLSPDDESREKLPFYAALGVKEAVLVEPNTREVEVYALRDGELKPVSAVEGVFSSAVLGITLQRVEGPKLLVRWGGGEVAI